MVVHLKLVMYVLCDLPKTQLQLTCFHFLATSSSTITTRRGLSRVFVPFWVCSECSADISAWVTVSSTSRFLANASLVCIILCEKHVKMFNNATIGCMDFVPMGCNAETQPSCEDAGLYLALQGQLPEADVLKIKLGVHIYYSPRGVDPLMPHTLIICLWQVKHPISTETPLPTTSCLSPAYGNHIIFIFGMDILPRHTRLLIACTCPDMCLCTSI